MRHACLLRVTCGEHGLLKAACASAAGCLLLRHPHPLLRVADGCRKDCDLSAIKAGAVPLTTPEQHAAIAAEIKALEEDQPDAIREKLVPGVWCVRVDGGRGRLLLAVLAAAANATAANGGGMTGQEAGLVAASCSHAGRPGRVKLWGASLLPPASPPPRALCNCQRCGIAALLGLRPWHMRGGRGTARTHTQH